MTGEHMYYPDLPCWCGGQPAFGVPHNLIVRYGREGACCECGLVGNLGAELTCEGPGFICVNRRRCQARADNSYSVKLTDGSDNG